MGINNYMYVLTELVENPRLAETTSGTRSAGRALLVSTNFTDCGELKTMNSPFPKTGSIEKLAYFHGKPRPSV